MLSARILDSVADVNHYQVVQQAAWYEGDNVDFYFQLIDANQDRSDQGFSPAGRRYMPAAGATLLATIVNIDDAKKIIRSASQPFPQDPSIWKISILSSDTVSGTADMVLTLTEPGSPSKVTGARIAQAVSVQPSGTLV